VRTTAQLSQSDERRLRELAPQVLAAVVRRFGDFASSEDAVQEALLAASTQWPSRGTPDNPLGWLIQVASHRFTDQLRSDLARKHREAQAAVDAGAISQVSEAEEDDTLVLLFMCCHPALTPSSAIALTLRAVGGLTTREIASAYLVPEATMAQRISRAKQTIRASGIRFQPPEAGERTRLLTSVLHVLYLIFNEGYTSSAGATLRRADLSDEAIRLTRMLYHAQPEEPEVAGLLALMLLTDARRAARTGSQGELVSLDEQDRTRWDQHLIEEGTVLLTSALPRGSVGIYQLQAAIAALHDEAPRADETDWPQILALYELLKRMSDNPIVALNHAIATAMVRGPREGLALLATLEIPNYHRLDAAKAHLWELAGDREAAIRHFRLAASGTASLPERDFLMGRASRLIGGDSGNKP
jgi:RNA polymerase sigma factor (sigma-70 family)